MRAWLVRSGYFEYIDEGLYAVVHTKADAIDAARAHFAYEPPRGLITDLRKDGQWNDGNEYVELFKIDAVLCPVCGDALLNPWTGTDRNFHDSADEMVCDECARREQ